MRILSPIIAILLGEFLGIFSAFAGAWTQAQGSGQLITTASYYHTQSYWNSNGKLLSQPTYDEYTLNPYFEYGLRDDLTIGTNLLLQRAHQDAFPSAAAQTNVNLGDSEFFLRKRLWQGSGFVVSAEPVLKLPSPESSRAMPQLGSSSIDAGIGLLGGYGFSAYGQHHFIDIGTEYRHRFGTPHDQAKIAATLGLGITDRFMLMPQMFTTYRLVSPKNAAFTNSSANDYNLVKLQLSGVYTLCPQTSAQLGVFDNVSGRNTGRGAGGFMALWNSF